MDRSGDGLWKCRVKLISYPTITRYAGAGDQIQRRLQGVRPAHPNIHMHQLLDYLR